MPKPITHTHAHSDAYGNTVSYSHRHPNPTDDTPHSAADALTHPYAFTSAGTRRATVAPDVDPDVDTEYHSSPVFDPR